MIYFKWGELPWDPVFISELYIEGFDSISVAFSELELKELILEYVLGNLNFLDIWKLRLESG